MPCPSALVPSIERLRSTELSPMKIPITMIRIRGITLATMVKLWKATPSLAPRRLRAVKKMIIRIAIIFTANSDSPNVPLKPVTAAIASEAIEPEHVSINMRIH